MEIAYYKNEKNLNAVAKRHGWRIAASLPVPPGAAAAARLRAEIALECRGKKQVIVELSRPLAADGSVSDYMVFYR